MARAGSQVRTSYWVQSQSTSEEGLRAAESQVGMVPSKIAMAGGCTPVSETYT